MSDDRRTGREEDGEVDLEGLEEDRTGQVKSPVSGIDSAAEAGTSFQFTARSLFAKRTHRRVKSELPAYLMIQCSWYMAFGLQMVLFPYLITGPGHLHMDGLALGLANMALSLPSVIFLLIGGVVAERADGKRLLILLHLLAAAPAMLLAFYVGPGELTYPMMIFYALSIGTIGAFMMPARDSIVNEVVERRVRVGSGVTLQLGVTLATMDVWATDWTESAAVKRTAAAQPTTGSSTSTMRRSRAPIPTGSSAAPRTSKAARSNCSTPGWSTPSFSCSSATGRSARAIGTARLASLTSPVPAASVFPRTPESRVGRSLRSRLGWRHADWISALAGMRKGAGPALVAEAAIPLRFLPAPACGPRPASRLRPAARRSRSPRPRSARQAGPSTRSR